MKYDVYATIAIQIEARSMQEAVVAAQETPIEYWDDDSLDITEAVGHAD